MACAPQPPRQHLASHPHADECWVLLDLAFRTHGARAHRADGDLPFGVVLTHAHELHVLGHGPEAATSGLIEDIEARLWSLRTVLRACARCSHVELSSATERMDALRVQLEHIDGPPLDVYRPLANGTGWWVEAGEALLGSTRERGPDTGRP